MSDREIAELQRQLRNLTIEFQRRTNEINTQLTSIRNRQEQEERRAAEERRVTEGIESDEESECGGFVRGNIVRITNSYKGCKGIVGEVKFWNRTKDRITIVDAKGKPYLRAPWNLELVEP